MEENLHTNEKKLVQLLQECKVLSEKIRNKTFGKVLYAQIANMLIQLKTRPTFEEQWPDEYQDGLAKGKARVLKLESIRTAPTDMAAILSERPDVKQWWDQVGTN